MGQALPGELITLLVDNYVMLSLQIPRAPGTMENVPAMPYASQVSASSPGGNRGEVLILTWRFGASQSSWPRIARGGQKCRKSSSVSATWLAKRNGAE
jgi:hypothetical protein